MSSAPLDSERQSNFTAGGGMGAEVAHHVQK